MSDTLCSTKDLVRMFWKTSYKISILSIVLLAVVASVVPYIVTMEYGFGSSRVNFWLRYTAVVLSALSVFAIAVTLLIQQRQIENNFRFAKQTYDLRVMKIITELVSENMDKHRKNCWILKNDLENEETAVEEMREVLSHSIRGSWEKYGSKSSSLRLRHKQFASFVKLVRKMRVISEHELSKTTANSIHFYYIYFRPLVEKMVNMYVQCEKEIDNEEMAYTVRPGWLNVLSKMDSAMREHGLAVK